MFPSTELRAWRACPRPRLAADRRTFRWFAAPLIVLALWPLGPAAGGETGSTPPIELAFTAADGVSLLADFYRPARPCSVGVILLHDRGGTRRDWDPWIPTLTERGIAVVVPDLRGHGESARTGRKRGVWEGTEDATQVWMDYVAAASALEDRLGGALAATIPIGAGWGAAAAVVGASRTFQPPAALLLLTPEPALGEIPLAPVLLGLDVAVLLVAPRGDAPLSAASRDLYLRTRPRSQFWEVDAGGAGAALVARSPFLSVDLADWLLGVSGRLPVRLDTVTVGEDEGH